MRRSFRPFGLLLVGGFIGLALPVSAAPANTTAGERSLMRHEKSINRKCSSDVTYDCSAISKVPGGRFDTIAARTATDACTTFNKSMSTFCDLVGDHEPDSPEMLSATAKVIAAKKELLRQLSLAAAAKHS